MCKVLHFHLPNVLQDLSITSTFTLPSYKYLVEHTNYKAPHYVIFSIFLSLPLSYIQISLEHPTRTA